MESYNVSHCFVIKMNLKMSKLHAKKSYKISTARLRKRNSGAKILPRYTSNHGMCSVQNIKAFTIICLLVAAVTRNILCFLSKDLDFLWKIDEVLTLCWAGLFLRFSIMKSVAQREPIKFEVLQQVINIVFALQIGTGQGSNWWALETWYWTSALAKWRQHRWLELLKANLC